MSMFSERVYELMREQDLTQKDLANTTGLTEPAISNYVQGKRVPMGDTLAKIANALNTTTDYLLGTSANPSRQQNELLYLQRNLGKLDPEQLKKAESILKTVFDDIFEDDEGEG